MSDVFNPLPWQVTAFRDKSPVLLLTGGAGGGKSTIAAEKMHAICMKYPGTVCVGLRKAREYATKSVVYALKRAQAGFSGVTYSSSDLIFQYSNGSLIFIAGLKDENQRQAIRSINGDGSLDFLWVEEANALTEDDYNELLPRMRANNTGWRQILLTTNPDAPTHWIKRRLIDGREATVISSNHLENFHNPDDYEATLSGLTGVMGARLRDGEWIQAQGAIYEQPVLGLHIVNSFEIPKDWRRIRSIDFGYTNPFVCQWWAQSPDDILYLYREIYMSHRTVRIHAEQINSFLGEYEANVADHDAEDRATLSENDIETVAAKKSVSVGIQRVAYRLRVRENGKPGLCIMNGALVEEDQKLLRRRLPLCTEQEFPGYVWADGKEVPVKLNDHGLDALRYAVMYFDDGPTSEKLDNFFW